MENKENTILVIDAEKSVDDYCCQDLSRKGYRIKTTSDWKNGMILVGKLHPDLVILDHALAGKESIRKISSIDPTIVIIETPEYTTIKSAVEAMKSGASDFLPKPWHGKAKSPCRN